MSAALVEISKAVAARLTAADEGTFALPFTAERRVSPIRGLDELVELKVDVIGRKSRTVLVDRAGDAQVDYEIDVCVRKQLANIATPTEHDRLVWLVEQLQLHFYAYDLRPDRDETQLESSTDADGVADWWQPHVHEMQLFFSVVTLTFRGFNRAP